MTIILENGYRGGRNGHRGGGRLTEDKLRILETVTDFNLEARYPDEKFLFKRKCTKKFIRDYLNELEVMKKWLVKQIK